MLESSVRLLLAMVRAKPRLALAPESRGRIAANVALFNSFGFSNSPPVVREEAFLASPRGFIQLLFANKGSFI